jgi:pSer/pThr/pTyr-binding forkhead associated (FHA) protein
LAFLTSAHRDEALSVTVCPYCGRDNEPGAQFCIDCGKPLTKTAAFQRAAADSEGRLAPAHATIATRAVRASTKCPHCGASLPSTGPRTDFRFTLVLVDEGGDELERFACEGPETTIGREGGDVRFADDAFLSPLHARLSWEESGLVVRDLGSRNGTWVFVQQPHRLMDGDLLLVGSQLLRFRRLGYPGPYAQEADATRRMGSLVPRADIASLTQVRSDGSTRDVTHLSPGRDVYLGRERGDWVFPYDQTMSAQHALIRSEDADFVVVDQSSRNGVALAARGALPLTDGSRLLVGDKLLRVELPA